MDKFSLYAAQFLTFKEYFVPKGHNACKGCGVALSVRQVYKALEGLAQNIEKAKWQTPWEQSLIVKGDDAAASQLALLTIFKGKDEKGDVLHICFDNESTDGKTGSNVLFKRLPAVASASGYAYAATACPSHPFDLVEKVRTGWEAKGSAFIYILCPCPVAWKFDPENTVKIGRMAVETRVFPLYSISQGYYQITSDEITPRPVKDYVKSQERFLSWSAKKIAELQDAVTAAFSSLKDKANKGM